MKTNHVTNSHDATYEALIFITEFNPRTVVLVFHGVHITISAVARGMIANSDSLNRCARHQIIRCAKTPDDPQNFISDLPEVAGKLDAKKFDETTEKELSLQEAANHAEAMQDSARYARRIRKRLGLSQAEFSQRIGVSVDTVRNWEQGKRMPTGAAKALLKVLDKAPEAALAALS
jgi:putative transcriptional regulator